MWADVGQLGRSSESDTGPTREKTEFQFFQGSVDSIKFTVLQRNSWMLVPLPWRPISLAGGCREMATLSAVSSQENRRALAPEAACVLNTGTKRKSDSLIFQVDVRAPITEEPGDPPAQR